MAPREALDIAQQPSEQRCGRVGADSRELRSQATVDDDVALLNATESVVREEEDVDGQLRDDADRYASLAGLQVRDPDVLLGADRPVFAPRLAASGEAQQPPLLRVHLQDELRRGGDLRVLANHKSCTLRLPAVHRG